MGRWVGVRGLRLGSLLRDPRTRRLANVLVLARPPPDWGRPPSRRGGHRPSPPLFRRAPAPQPRGGAGEALRVAGLPTVRRNPGLHAYPGIEPPLKNLLPILVTFGFSAVGVLGDYLL